MCDSPHENVAQGATLQFYLGPRGARPLPPTPTWGALWAPFSAIQPIVCLYSRCGASVRPLLCPKWGQRRPKVPKRCQKGAQKLTFRSPARHFWVPPRREWPLVKTSAGAMFSSHYEGPGPSLFAPKIDSGTQCAPEGLFFTLLCPLLVPKCLQRRPKGAQRAPKEPQSLPRDA